MSKEEWGLNEDTVMYGSTINLNETLGYGLEKEKNFDYKGLSMGDIIKHLSRFVVDLWQIHVFGEGKTRTTAVFLIKYLNKLGFFVTNDTFEKHSWYFRNLLLEENNKLSNR